MAVDLYTGAVQADQFRQLSAIVNTRFRRDVKAQLPRHLFEGQQPFHATGGYYGSFGFVPESSFAVIKDPHLRVFPNYISRQPVVYSALRTRVRSVVSRKWSLKPWNEDNEADKRLTEAVQKSIESIGTAAALPIRNTIDEIREQALWEMGFYGSAFIAVLWNDQLSGVRQLEMMPRTAMTYYRNRGSSAGSGEEGWRWYDQGCGLTAQPVLPGQMIFVTNEASRLNPWGVGVVDALYWLSFFEGVVMPLWAKWLERHASPWVVGKSGNTTDLASLQAVLDASFDNPNLTIPSDTTIEFVQPGTAAHSIYQSFMDWCNAARREVILGTSLTTAAPQPHGSYALANIHQDSTEEILQGDAKALDNALTWSLCSWLAQVHGPTFRGATRLDDGRVAPPYFATSIERAKDVNVVGQTLQIANQYVDLPKALIYELLPDIRPPKDGEETIPAGSRQPGAPPGTPPGDAGSLADLLGGGAPEAPGVVPVPAQRFAEHSLGEVADREFAEIEKLMASATTRVRDAKKNSCPTREPALSATGTPWWEVIP